MSRDSSINSFMNIDVETNRKSRRFQKISSKTLLTINSLNGSAQREGKY